MLARQLAPSWALAYVGFGMMPPKSTTVLPAASSWPRTWSYGPLRLMEPPPNASITTSPMRAISASSAFAVVPSPKWTGVRVIERNRMHLLVLLRGCAGRVRRLGAEGPQPRFAVRRSLACVISIATGGNNRSSASASKFTSITFFYYPHLPIGTPLCRRERKLVPKSQAPKARHQFPPPANNIMLPRAWAVGVFSASAHFGHPQWSIVLVG